MSIRTGEGRGRSDKYCFSCKESFPRNAKGEWATFELGEDPLWLCSTCLNEADPPSPGDQRIERDYYWNAPRAA